MNMGSRYIGCTGLILYADCSRQRRGCTVLHAGSVVHQKVDPTETTEWEDILRKKGVIGPSQVGSTYLHWLWRLTLC